MAAGLQAIDHGVFEQAIRHLTEAADQSWQVSNKPAQLEASLYLSEAYVALGQYRNATESLEVARRLAEEIGDQQHVIQILGSVGHLYLAAGQETEATHYLSEGLQRSKQLGQHELTAAILNNLGNLWARQKHYAEAIQAYAESIKFAGASLNRPVLARALLNSAMAFLQMKQYVDAKERLDQAFDEARNLPPSHDKSYDLITIGLTYYKLRPSLANQDEILLTAYEALNGAIAAADVIKSAGASSYAIGYLGLLYEHDRQYQVALELTRQAISLAQQVAASEALYRWHWQSARLFTALGQQAEALAAYRRAVAALQTIRPELSTTSSDPESSFRETVGGVYFELADLLLQRAASYAEQAQSEPYLKEARDVIELFKVGELRDYFRDDCVEAARAKATPLETVSEKTAVIYPILLTDRLELLVSLPAGIQRASVSVSADTLTEEIRIFRYYLEKRSTHEYLPPAQQLYDRLVRPLEPLLNGASIETLVFVPDGALRTIPMAALHDGKQFLITKYAIATTPGLTLTDPRPLKRENILAFSGGLTEAVRGFPPLPNVSDEIQTVKGLYSGTSLLDQDFVIANVEQALKKQPFSIVHIASHGQFESDVKNSFVLAFDDKLTMDRLDEFVGLFRFRDEPLALLTLSACETAAGDDRAALGLAGVAIKAGARSALATLWFINDEVSSALVSEFYQQLHDAAVSKALALQRAQLKVLEHPIYRHPAYWAAFLLLNNWL
jgi:CHAT domain-containing protein/Tfp pilus assembly protein PilF